MLIMKLIKLRSIANNAVRESIWTPEAIGLDPFYWVRPKERIIIDLLTGNITPNLKGDSVEKFYHGMSKWFLQVLHKEGISLDVIESAEIIIAPEGKKCIIKAQGKVFESFQKKSKS